MPEDAIRMTDKEKTKVVECSYPGCSQDLIVSKFASAKKARCPEHKGKNTPTMLEAVVPESDKDQEDYEPNRSLQNLRCPMDGAPMKIIRVDDDMGFVTFQCEECRSAVEIMPEFGSLLVRNIPEGLKDVIESFNQEQIEKYREAYGGEDFFSSPITGN